MSALQLGERDGGGWEVLYIVYFWGSLTFLTLICKPNPGGPKEIINVGREGKYISLQIRVAL